MDAQLARLPCLCVMSVHDRKSRSVLIPELNIFHIREISEFDVLSVLHRLHLLRSSLVLPDVVAEESDCC